ncbi:transcription-repair coupling factor [Solirubrobacter sp. CPCC 204708]|uniref:Transcription-repair-coupling factor n=1 Tax=Solirubrobacter deserti TaxID=2282478 RepID=A0ABT4RI74_9ACTN|nr:transcription-repair coupling factor [Solirubrobacter deserti]MBE2318856.1 transcription-repair coupling factor [Solirubrobacter deserti]MDA0138236.1 transcription-repair coupling factor [Solirubrobacter deserti]
MLRTFLNHLDHDPAAAQLANEGGSAFVSLSLRPFVVAALADQDAKRPALVVVGDDRAARDLAADLKAWLHPRTVRYYPSRGVAYESHLTPPPHLVGLRVAALDALTDTPEGSEQPVVVVSATALSEKVPDPKLRPHGFMLRVGDLIDLNEVSADLVAAGYERVDQVEERGQFAIRGGLLDVYPATEERAVRVDLFDIEIEALRWFSTFTQRSLGETECVEISPAAELAPEHREMAEIAASDAPEDRPDIAELLPVEHFQALLELIPERTQVIVAAEEDVEPTLRDHWEDVCTAFDDQDARDLYVNPKTINEALAARAQARLSSISQNQPIEIRAQAADFAARNLSEAESELEKLVRSDYTTVVAWPQMGAAERAAYNLDRIKASLNGARKGLIFTEASLRDGFVAPGLKLAAFPEHRLIHRKKASTRPTRKGRGLLRSFTDLRTGDYIVHEDHGIARFAGFDTKTVAGTTRDYLNLEFQGDDKVFMPVDQLAKISRYLGADGGAPTLSKLGGTRWDKVKARARRAAQELAGELLNLYAERKRRRGHAFPEFSEELRDLEANFPYRETPDQRDAIDNVIADMESERPMDRLICGDVGYGKTEVALRAAVKAASDGKQVLMLVPTTILAQQHYGTFVERLRDQPFEIEHVSRFRSAAEQRDAVKRFAEGKVDILIGTHRLLSRDVRAKELGLLIVDEEQRFGVKQKELMRQLKLKVDVISMSATPIPRTLQMSLAGLRDISVIETPPEGRRPVKTYVGEYDEQLVKQALEREIARQGQAFFLHNRVDDIEETAERLRSLCPQLTFTVAHGQMDEKTLEERMMGFLRGEADVLVSTSIIESGIDIPQANTLIVDRADLFGLSQLYQIRGRVGRSRERAYAYLLYPSAAALTPEAADRLSALSDYTELGAGFKVAMRDLELRGAGNLLGDEQSGHVAALGFELYMQMLDEAVRAMDPDEDGAEPPEPVRLDINVDAYVPADYIPYEQAKVDVHRRIAGARENSELMELRTELEDRFGEIPEPLENLITLQQARIKLGRAGATAVSFKQGRLAVTPIELDSTRARQLREILPGANYEAGRSQLSLRVPDDPQQRFPAVVQAADALLSVCVAA